MRYYLYISESKLNDVLQDIPNPVKLKASGKLKFNGVLFGGEVGLEETSIESQNIRLKFVESFIHKNESIGPCYNPKSWIHEGDISLKIIRPFGLMSIPFSF